MPKPISSTGTQEVPAQRLNDGLECPGQRSCVATRDHPGGWILEVTSPEALASRCVLSAWSCLGAVVSAGLYVVQYS